MLWFEVDQQEKILIDYLPKGAAYKQASIKGSNFNNLILTIASSFRWLASRFNRTFKGLYITESDALLEKWKIDYGVPSDVFRTSDVNRLDVYCLRYLMHGNSEWNFRAIANLYLLDVIVEPGSKDNPVTDDKTVDYITIKYLPTNAGFLRLPYKIPHYLRTDGSESLTKIKKIYNIIRPRQLQIIYEAAPADAKFPERIVFPPNI